MVHRERQAIEAVVYRAKKRKTNMDKTDQQHSILSHDRLPIDTLPRPSRFSSEKSYYDCVDLYCRNFSDGGRFVFAVVNEHEDKGRKEWQVEYIADPDHSFYEYDTWDGADNPICQYGKCDNCGSYVRSIAKHATCPVCWNMVYCT